MCNVITAILKNHFFSKHLGHKVLCPICNKKFISNSVKNRHLREVHGIANHKKLKNSGNEFGNKLETQAFQTNQSFPTIVDAFQVKNSITFGKQLVAKEDITVGNTVMVSTAFASVEYLLCIRDSSCFQCGKRAVAAKEIRCPHCINVRFCSWKCSLSRVHRIKCNQMFNQDDCKTVRLVLEIIDKASKFFPDVTVFLDFCAHVVLNLFCSMSMPMPMFTISNLNEFQAVKFFNKRNGKFEEMPETLHAHCVDGFFTFDQNSLHFHCVDLKVFKIGVVFSQRKFFRDKIHGQNAIQWYRLSFNWSNFGES